MVCCKGCNNEIKSSDSVIVMDYRDRGPKGLSIFHAECIDSLSIEENRIFIKGKWEDVEGKVAAELL